MSSIPPERRDGSRLDLQLRVRYATLDQATMGEAEATDVSAHGLRIESRKELAPGTRLNVELDDGQGHAEKGTAEVTWCRQRKTPSGKEVFDLGLKLDQDWIRGASGPLAQALRVVFGL